MDAGQRTKAHPYDNPNLMPKEFLLAVMHDPTVSLYRRIHAAEELLKLWPHPYQYVPPHLTIVIGGLPEDVSVSVNQGKDPMTNDHGSHELRH